MLLESRNFSSFHPAHCNHFTLMGVQSHFFYLVWSQAVQVPLFVLGLAEAGHATEGIQHLMGWHVKS